MQLRCSRSAASRQRSEANALRRHLLRPPPTTTTPTTTYYHAKPPTNQPTNQPAQVDFALQVDFAITPPPTTPSVHPPPRCSSVAARLAAALRISSSSSSSSRDKHHHKIIASSSSNCLSCFGPAPRPRLAPAPEPRPELSKLVLSLGGLTSRASDSPRIPFRGPPNREGRSSLEAKIPTPSPYLTLAPVPAYPNSNSQPVLCRTAKADVANPPPPTQTPPPPPAGSPRGSFFTLREGYPRPFFSRAPARGCALSTTPAPSRPSRRHRVPPTPTISPCFGTFTARIPSPTRPSAPLPPSTPPGPTPPTNQSGFSLPSPHATCQVPEPLMRLLLPPVLLQRYSAQGSTLEYL